MPRHGVALGLSATAYAVCHHLGSLPGGLGAAPHQTRWADWLDLLVPFVVLTPALLTLMAARVSRTTYLVFALGSWLYATGHGVHLSANSVGNVAPGEPEHLWDELVGHAIWYAGVAVVAATLAGTMTSRPRPSHPLAWLLAVAVGATWGTNATGGHFTGPGAVLSLAALGWGLQHRRDQGATLAAVGVSALVALVVSALVA